MGPELAGEVACILMAFAQVLVVLLLALWGLPSFAVLVAISLGVQLLLMRRLLIKPRELAPWYQGTGVSLYVLGMMVSAIGLRYLPS
jgi:chlorophyll synthase